MMTFDVAKNLVNALAEHPGIFTIKKDEAIDSLMSTNLKISKFHLKPQKEFSHVFQEGSDKYYCLSVRRILIKENMRKISLLKRILGKMLIGNWSSSLLARRIRASKVLSKIISESDSPFALLAKLETFLIGKDKFIKILNPILVISGMAKESKNFVLEWERKNTRYEMEKGFFPIRYFKRISYKKYLEYS